MEHFLNTPHQVYAVTIVIGAWLIAVGLNWHGEAVASGLSSRKNCRSKSTLVYLRDTSRLELLEIEEATMSGDGSLSHRLSKGFTIIRVESLRPVDASNIPRFKVTLAKFKPE